MAWDPNETKSEGGFEPPEIRLPPNLIGIIALVAVVLGLLYGMRSSFFTVASDETAVVLRLGKFSHTAPPGFHILLPFGFDRAQVFPTTRVLKQEFGFRTVRPDVRTEYARTSFDDESLMLTGDLNVADVEWIVQYRILDPKAYWFNLSEAEQTVRDVSEAVMRQVIGNRTVDDVLTRGRAQIEDRAENSMQKVLDSYGSGIAVTAVQLQNVTPPEPVQPSFNDVNRAEQDREKMENEALARRNREIPNARGEAARRIDRSLGYKQARINRARGEVARFTDLLREYRKAPEVTRRRIYLETLSRVLPEVDDLVLIDEHIGRNMLGHLDLGGAPSGGSNDKDAASVKAAKSAAADSAAGKAGSGPGSAAPLRGDQ